MSSILNFNNPFELDKVVCEWQEFDSNGTTYVSDPKRVQLEKLLLEFQSSENALPTCVQILDEFSQNAIKISSSLEFFCFSTLHAYISKLPLSKLESTQVLDNLRTFLLVYITRRTQSVLPFPPFCKNAWVKLAVQIEHKDTCGDQQFVQKVQQWINSDNKMLSQLGTDVLAAFLESLTLSSTSLSTLRKSQLKKLFEPQVPQLFENTCALIRKLLGFWKTNPSIEKQIETSLSSLIDLTSWWRLDDRNAAQAEHIFMLDDLLHPPANPPTSFIEASWTGNVLNIYSNLIGQTWSSVAVNSVLTKLFCRLCQLLQEQVNSQASGDSLSVSPAAVDGAESISVNTSSSSLISDGQFNFELSLLDVFCLIIKSHWSRLASSPEFPTDSGFLPLWWNWTLQQLSIQKSQQYVFKKLAGSWKSILLDAPSKVEWRAEFLSIALKHCSCARKKQAVKLSGDNPELQYADGLEEPSPEAPQEDEPYDFFSVIVQLVEAYPQDHLNFVLCYCLDNRNFDTISCVPYVDLCASLSPVLFAKEYFDMTGGVLQLVLLQLNPQANGKAMIKASFLNCLRSFVPWISEFYKQSHNSSDSSNEAQLRANSEGLFKSTLQCALYYLSNDQPESIQIEAANLLYALGRLGVPNLLHHTEFYPDFLCGRVTSILERKPSKDVLVPLLSCIAFCFLTKGTCSAEDFELKRAGFADFYKTVLKSDFDLCLILLQWAAADANQVSREALYFAVSESVTLGLDRLQHLALGDTASVTVGLKWLSAMQSALFKQLNLKQVEMFWGVANGLLAAMPKLVSIIQEQDGATENAASSLNQIMRFVAAECQQVFSKTGESRAFLVTLAQMLCSCILPKTLLELKKCSFETSISYIRLVGSLLRNQFKLFFPVSMVVSKVNSLTNSNADLLNKGCGQSEATILVGHLISAFVLFAEPEVTAEASKQLLLLDAQCSLFSLEFFQTSDELFGTFVVNLLQLWQSPKPQLLLDIYGQLLWKIVAKSGPRFMALITNASQSNSMLHPVVSAFNANPKALETEYLFFELLDSLTRELNSL